MAKAKAKSKGNKGKKGKQAKLSKKKGVKRKVAATKTRKGASKKKAAPKKRTAPKLKMTRVKPAPVMDTSPEITEVPTEAQSEPAMESTETMGTASEFTTTDNTASSM
jgi:hypothetical protein